MSLGAIQRYHTVAVVSSGSLDSIVAPNVVPESEAGKDVMSVAAAKLSFGGAIRLEMDRVKFPIDPLFPATRKSNSSPPAARKLTGGCPKPDSPKPGFVT